MDALENDLRCPITLDLMEDPVTLPCCGKAAGRAALISAGGESCPLCRADWSDVDLSRIPTNRVLQSLIATFVASRQPAAAPPAPQGPRWTATVTPAKNSTIARLDVSVEHSVFEAKKSLFIAVVDRSGSMGGNPWKQVETALLHVFQASKASFGGVEVAIVAYDSSAKVYNTVGRPDHEVERDIRTMYTGGGTVFANAFTTVTALLESLGLPEACATTRGKKPKASSSPYGSVSIAFLTDGQDNHEKNGKKCAESFRALLSRFDQTVVPICVHAVGFSAGCDRGFLEELRKAGTNEGTFRYAEPNDGADALCSKLSALLQFSLAGCTFPLTLALPAGMRNATDGTDTARVDLPIDFITRGGTVSTFVTLESALSEPLRITAEVARVAVPVTSPTDGEADDVLQQWLRKELDTMSQELLDISNTPASTPRNLRVALFLKRLEAMARRVQDPRVALLNDQALKLRANQTVNLSKLADSRFGSYFANPASAATTVTNVPPPPQPPAAPAAPFKVAPYRERPYCISFSQRRHNPLHSAIMQCDLEYISDTKRASLLALATADNLIAKDDDGNTAVHLAAYCGQFQLIDELLQRCANADSAVNVTNSAGETPLTLAVKRRGFDKTINVLVKHGAAVPSNRRSSLEQYAVSQGFQRTAALLSSLGDSSTSVDLSMSADFIQFRFKAVVASGKAFDAASFLQAAMAKQLVDVVATILDLKLAVVQPSWFLEYSFPPKPDDPATPTFIRMTEIVLAHQPDLLHATVPVTGETLLHRAVEKGSLPHVQFYLAKCLSTEARNSLGNTPLWLACAKRYPCIVDELLLNGADPNAANAKGNVPMSQLCQMGPVKMVERLLSAGAQVQHINANGDTLVLLAVRNGQSEILKLLLNYVDPDFIDFKAHIDGFNAMFAAVEGDRVECIRVLHAAGVSVNQRTAPDNQIVADATPLHLAAFYGRTASLQLLLDLGAEIDSVDASGMTALHVAVIRGQLQAVRILRGSGANDSIRDRAGNRPVAYCRENHHIREALADPLADVLLQYARGHMEAADIAACSAVLKQHSSIPHFLPASACLAVRGDDGAVPLVEAVLYGNVAAFATLVEVMGPRAVDEVYDAYGLTAAFWAQWSKQPRFAAVGGWTRPKEPLPTTARVTAACSQLPDNTSLLFLSPPPSALMGPRASSKCSASSLVTRMTAFVNHIVRLDTPTADTPAAVKALATVKRLNPAMALTAALSAKTPTAAPSTTTLLDPITVEEAIWRAKLHAIAAVAMKAPPKQLTVAQRMVCHAMTSQANIALHLGAVMLNTKSDQPVPQHQQQVMSFGAHLLDALTALPPFEGEVFIGANDLMRGNFTPGTRLSWSTFTPSTTMWPIAVGALTDFSKAGTILMIQSKRHGRLISACSHFAHDMEVLFPPGVAFVVHAWYRGDVICLGQANIRSHTFGVTTEAELTKLRDSNKPLIIELHEV